VLLIALTGEGSWATAYGSSSSGAALVSGTVLPHQPPIGGVVRVQLEVRNDTQLAWSPQDLIHLTWKRADGTRAAEDVHPLGQAAAPAASIQLALVTLAPASVGDFNLVTELETRGTRLTVGDPSPYHLSGFLFNGRGNGHGLGMSQWGARGRGSAGEDYKQILAAYYQGSSIDSRDTSAQVRIALTHGTIDLRRQWARLFGPFPMIAGPVTVDSPALQLGAGDLLGFSANPAGRPQFFVVPAGGQPGSPVVFSQTLTIRATSPAGIRTNLMESMGGDFRSGAEQRRYRGVLQVVPKGGANVLPISILPLEDYLKGVVPAEMPPSWGEEALKAQAVAARTYALRKIQGGGHGDFDLEGNEYDQAYNGSTEERVASSSAVDATRGQVLTSGGRLIDALFMASGGGHTENSEFGFIRWDHGLKPAVNLPYLRGIADPADRAPSWQVGPFSPPSAATVLRDAGEDIGDRLLGIDVLQKGPSGRVLGLRLRGSRLTVEISGPYLRYLFGLPDTLVEIVGGS
jgi:stage II sporulation protein D